MILQPKLFPPVSVANRSNASVFGEIQMPKWPFPEIEPPMGVENLLRLAV
jgi:hypothetical protein